MQNIPTDSLYKFMAISGIILIIVPLVFMYNYYNKLLVETYNNSLEVDILEIEAKHLREDVLSLEEGVNDFESRVGIKGNLIANENVLIKIEASNLSEITKSIDTKNKELEIKLIKTKNRLEINSVLRNNTKILLFLGKIFGVLGSILTVAGFSLWYYKIQIYQDKILKENAK